MKRVYVAGIYSTDENGNEAGVIQVLKNIRDGQKASLDVWRLGVAPFCPWLDFQFSFLDDEPITKEMYYTYSMAWLEVSDAIFVISGEGLGSGVDKEISRAKELKIPILYSIEALKTWITLKNMEVVYDTNKRNKLALECARG